MTDRPIPISGGRTLFATPVFDTYWRFARERQEIFMMRVRGNPPPWTNDPILDGHRFTNAYRASDRVSQYLIRHVQYTGDQYPAEVFFRTLLFKLFNKVETWETIVGEFGQHPRWCSDVDPFPRLLDVLDRMFVEKRSIYSGAYIMPSPDFGEARKHENHLMLLKRMMNRDRVYALVSSAKSLREVYMALRAVPSFGDFLAFQFAIDLNYSSIVNFSENDFVVAGPGAQSGIKKCFSGVGGLSDADVIRAVTDMQEAEFARLGLTFQTLWGRPLHLIDCQNLFCEVDKYARVAHPEVSGDRTKIKQKFTPVSRSVPQWYPPKWGLRVP
jgi:hypothetical protein